MSTETEPSSLTQPKVEEVAAPAVGVTAGTSASAAKVPVAIPKKRTIAVPSSSQPKKQPRVDTPKPPSIKEKLLSQLNQNKGSSTATVTNKRGTGPPPVIRSTSATNKYKEYSDKYTRLLKLELEDELTSVEERLKSWTTSRLETEGICLSNLRCEIGRSFNTKGITLRFSSDRSLEKGRFNHGDMVLLSRDNSLKNSISGVVLDKNPSWIQVLVSDVPDRAETSYWRIDKGANRVSFDRMIEAIQSFTNYNEGKCDLRGIICGSESGDLLELAKKRPNFETTSALGFAKKALDWSKIPSLDDLGLNDSQRQAIHSGLTSRLTLIQGPPGTGKTRTAVLLLKKIIEFQGTSCPLILASADTNVAVDNLLEGLLSEGIRAIRVGQPTKVRKALRDHTLHSLTENHPDARALREEKEMFLSMAKKLAQTTDPAEIEKIQGLLRGSQTRTESLELDVVRKVMKGAQVICSTCIGSGHEMLAAMSFPIVLVDEATQATEPSVIVPLVHKSKQVILLGDHFQLPPTVISARASREGLSKSLFQRLAEGGLQPNLLNIQYRMHPALSYFPTSAFYFGKVTDGITGESRPTPPGFPFPNPKYPVAFRAVKGLEDTTAEGSKYNKHDAAVVTRIVRDLLCAKDGIKGSELGVISPYSGQVRVLAKYFEKLGTLAADVDINSVDGYQGREKEVIIFSTVRSNEEGKVGFLQDWRRLNVALTRARRGLIVVGNPETLVNDERWKQYLDWINESNLLVKENFFYTGPSVNPTAMTGSASSGAEDTLMAELESLEAELQTTKATKAVTKETTTPAPENQNTTSVVLATASEKQSLPHIPSLDSLQPANETLGSVQTELGLSFPTEELPVETLQDAPDSLPHVPSLDSNETPSEVKFVQAEQGVPLPAETST